MPPHFQTRSNQIIPTEHAPEPAGLPQNTRPEELNNCGYRLVDLYYTVGEGEIRDRGPIQQIGGNLNAIDLTGLAHQREGEVIVECQWSEQIGWNHRANEREDAIGRHRGRKAAVVDGNGAVVAEIGMLSV